MGGVSGMYTILAASATLSAAATPATLSASYDVTVDMHISSLMPLFLSDDLNYEWADRLMHQEKVHTRSHGALAYQQHSMPWPLAPRDLLLSCEKKSDPRSAVLTSQCHSVEHEDAASPSGFVRFELSNSLWRVTALPNERTHLHLELETPAHSAAGVPKGIVQHIQRKSLRDSVNALLAAVRRLDLPPDETFARWKRSRAEAAAAAATRVLQHPSASDVRPSWLWPWLLLSSEGSSGAGDDGSSSSSSSSSLVLGLLVVLATSHVLSFGMISAQVRERASGSAVRAAEEEPQPRPRRARSVGSLQLIGGVCL